MKLRAILSLTDKEWLIVNIEGGDILFVGLYNRDTYDKTPFINGFCKYM